MKGQGLGNDGSSYKLPDTKPSRGGGNKEKENKKMKTTI